MQIAYRISEANGFARENEINKKHLISKLNNLSVLEYCIMKGNDIPRNAIRKILNGYESIPDYLMKNVELKPKESEESKNDNTAIKSKKSDLDYNDKVYRGNYNYSNLNANENNDESELSFNSEIQNQSSNKRILTVQEVVQIKAKFSDHAMGNDKESLFNYSISKEKLEENSTLLKTIIERFSDKIEILYFTKFILGEGYSFYFLLEILKKIKNSYSADITDDLYLFLEKNIFDFKIDFKIKNNLYNYLYKNEDLNFEIGNEFDFCIYKSGVNLNDLLYNYTNYTKDLLMEIKFKGKRSQIHFDGESVRAFTDNVNEADEEIIKKFCIKLENKIKVFNEKNNIDNTPDSKIKNFILSFF